MRNSITIQEVSSLTMVTAVAKNYMESMDDGALKELLAKDIIAVQKMTCELEWRGRNTEPKEDREEIS